MKVLLVGGGGREHALAWKLAASPLVDVLYVAPGNPGIARHARCVPIAVDAHAELVAFAERERIDFTVVGPEVPLVAGLADKLSERGLLALGPSAQAARLEGSKAFAKALMRDHGIPTAAFATFTDHSAALQYCRTVGPPLVVKADGLAAGKGALVCRSLADAARGLEQLMEQRVFGQAGATVVVEEFLSGEEVSFFVVTNGEEAVALGAAQDHKTVFDGDRGPNTGGMGAYSPVPFFGAAEQAAVMTSVVTPTLRALVKEGSRYQGVLYVGLMLTEAGPKVVEFNCRFGDPECQVLMPRLGSDLLPLLLVAARGAQLPANVAWTGDAAVCVNVASPGYPDRYATGLPITGVQEAESIAGVRVFHAGTAAREGTLVTAGGRVLGVTATAPALSEAISRAYAAIGRIRFEGMHYRTDIARKGTR
jgi:phosphoribosylamine---glycine ligase